MKIFRSKQKLCQPPSVVFDVNTEKRETHLIGDGRHTSLKIETEWPRDYVSIYKTKDNTAILVDFARESPQEWIFHFATLPKRYEYYGLFL
jgi:hypothetical protein